MTTQFVNIPPKCSYYVGGRLQLQQPAIYTVVDNMEPGWLLARAIGLSGDMALEWDLYRNNLYEVLAASNNLFIS